MLNSDLLSCVVRAEETFELVEVERTDAFGDRGRLDFDLLSCIV